MVSITKIENICYKICNYFYLKHTLFIEAYNSKYKRNTIMFTIPLYKEDLIETIKDIFKQEYGKEVTISKNAIIYFTYDEILEFYTILKMKGNI